MGRVINVDDLINITLSYLCRFWKVFDDKHTLKCKHGVYIMFVRYNIMFVFLTYSGGFMKKLKDCFKEKCEYKLVLCCAFSYKMI